MEDNQKIILPAQLTSYRPKSDGTFSVTFSTNEIPPEKVMDLFGLHNRFGILYFSDKETMNADEMAMLDNVDVELEKKSYSQRLRAVLFVFHKQNGGTEADFKPFYERSMENIIQRYKKQLEAQ